VNKQDGSYTLRWYERTDRKRRFSVMGLRPDGRFYGDMIAYPNETSDGKGATIRGQLTEQEMQQVRQLANSIRSSPSIESKIESQNSEIPPTPPDALTYIGAFADGPASYAAITPSATLVIVTSANESTAPAAAFKKITEILRRHITLPIDA